MERIRCGNMVKCRAISSRKPQNTMSSEPIYKVIFFNQGQVYELYVRSVYQSELMGFLEVEEFVFDERSKMIVDPGEEKLKSEFASVKRSYIPLHAVVRIDEVEKEGVCKVTDVKGSNVTPLPFPSMVPGPKKTD